MGTERTGITPVVPRDASQSTAEVCTTAKEAKKLVELALKLCGKLAESVCRSMTQEQVAEAVGESLMLATPQKVEAQNIRRDGCKVVLDLRASEAPTASFKFVMAPPTARTAPSSPARWFDSSQMSLGPWH
mmetsp:Transcript_2026/g.4517  ORF Transcript_2026/g.4517 Transcript_2026/m.4517 type:complete len:131 (-) Transcript_2026:492-884(-)